MKALLCAALLALCAPAAQDMGGSLQLDQHRWLEPLVGEWAIVAEMSMGDGVEPMRVEFTEKVRSIGGLWVVAESNGSMSGEPVTSIMTLGYDPAKGTFVGTWIDTMHTHLWSYVGEFDDARKVLTLSTEGPSWKDPSQIVHYRDVITLESPDKKVMTSSVQQEDGSWKQFLRAESRRKP